MLPKSGTIFISTRLPDGTISRTPIRAADEYFIDVQKDQTLITPVDRIQGLALNLSEASQRSARNNKSQLSNDFPADTSANAIANVDASAKADNLQPNINSSPSGVEGLPLDKPIVSKNPPQKAVPCEASFQQNSPLSAKSQQPKANSQQTAIDPFRSELISIATNPPKPKAIGDFDFGQFGTPGAFRQPKSFSKRFQTGNVPQPPYHGQNSHSGVQSSANSQKLHIDMPDFSLKPVKTEAINEPIAVSYSPIANSQKPIANSTDQSVSNEAYNIAQKRLKSLTPSHNPIQADSYIPQPQTNAKRLTINQSFSKFVGIALVVISTIGISVPYAKKAFFEGTFKVRQVKDAVAVAASNVAPLPPAVPLDFNPLVTPDGAKIVPINTDFSLIIPKIGVNAEVEAKVDPGKKIDYNAALKKGVAHASTSATPDQQGTVYLFSHSTNYEWFVKDLNAIFYLVKDLAPGDNIVVIYKGIRYTYKMTNKKIVKPNAVSYLLPDTTKKSLILQTCWPPGSTTERMLIFADLIDERGVQI
jgi:LPXTG-site transpeptidase (sortase) family protein